MAHRLRRPDQRAQTPSWAATLSLSSPPRRAPLSRARSHRRQPDRHRDLRGSSSGGISGGPVRRTTDNPPTMGVSNSQPRSQQILSTHRITSGARRINRRIDATGRPLCRHLRSGGFSRTPVARAQHSSNVEGRDGPPVDDDVDRDVRDTPPKNAASPLARASTALNRVTVRDLQRR